MAERLRWRQWLKIEKRGKNLLVGVVGGVGVGASGRCWPPSLPLGQTGTPRQDHAGSSSPVAAMSARGGKRVQRSAVRYLR